MPGVSLALVAGALVLALRRFYDPLPGRALALFVLLVVVLLGECLFAGRVLWPVDELAGFAPFADGEAPSGEPRLAGQMLEVAPALAAVRAALRRGEWPLWQPHAGAGMPLLAIGEAQPLQPTVLAALPLGLPQAAAVTAGLRLWLALCFFFLLLRRVGVDEASATVGALAYGAGGFLQLSLGWPQANVAAWLPAAVYALLRCAQVGTRRDLLLLGLSGFGLLASGEPETTRYALLLLLAIALALANSQPPGERLRMLARWGAVMALAAALSAPVLMPMAKQQDQTYSVVKLREAAVENRRRDPLGLAALVSSAERNELFGLRRLSAVFAPAARGERPAVNEQRREPWVQPPAGSFGAAGGFVGTATLLLVMVALGWRGSRRLLERLHLATAGVCLLFVAAPPPLLRMLEQVPILWRSPSAHRRVTLILCFAFAFLAACALDAWRSSPSRRRPLVGAIVLAALVFISHLQVANSAVAGSSLRWLLLQLAVLTVAAALMLASRPRWVPLGLALLVLGELVLWHGPANPSAAAARFFPTTPAVAALQQLTQGEPGARIAGLGASLRPNVGAIYRLSDARFAGASEPTAMRMLTRSLSAPPSLPPPLVGSPGSPILDLLGVRWFVTQPGRTLRLPLHASDDDAWIYRRPRALPPLFFPAAVEIYRGGDWQEWVRENRSFAARSLAEVDLDGALLASGSGGAATVALRRFEPTRISARVELESRRLLATSVYQDGGWRLLVDGAAYRVILANGPLVASWLPAGAHDLELVYRSRGLLAGCLLAACGIALGLAWLVPPPAHEGDGEEAA